MSSADGAHNQEWPCHIPFAMMTIKELLDRYNAIARQSGEPVPLSAFQFPAEETSRLFTALDEDYHISRFLHFTSAEGEQFTIAGERVTHVRIDPAISSLL